MGRSLPQVVSLGEMGGLVSLSAIVEERRTNGTGGSGGRLGRGAIQEGICTGLYETAGGSGRIARLRLDNGLRVGLRLSPAEPPPEVGAAVRVRGALGAGDEGIGRLRLA
jgi:hypothetical protein